MKPFIKSDLLSRVRFHTTDMNLDDFHKKCIPKSCLPSEYGGDLGPIEDIREKHKKSLLRLRDYFLIEEKILNFQLEEYDFDAASEDDEIIVDTKM